MKRNIIFIVVLFLVRPLFAQESGRMSAGQEQDAGVKLPSPWCDMLDMKASGKTLFTVEAEYSLFTLDWHIGCRIYCYRYFIGIGFQGPITSLRECPIYTERVSNLILNIGVTF